MTGMLQKRISKLLTPLKNRHSSGKDGYDVVRTLTVDCSTEHTTDDVLSQLQDVSQNKHVTCVVLREMIQRSDNVQLFTRIQDLLRESKFFSNVHSIRLVEPHVHSAEYRRWCFKKTNFLHRVHKEANERHIDVATHGTLILDGGANNSNNESLPQMSQNVSNCLSLIEHLPQDPDITSLWISLREEAVVHTAPGVRRPSQLDLLQSPVQKVFQALVELFNADTRHWQFIHCHVLYHAGEQEDEEIHKEQTEALLEVAELFHIPLQVQWQPVSTNSDDCVARIRTRATSAAQNRRVSCLEVMDQQGDDDNTSTTVGMDGSSGAFTAGLQTR